ncbi:MAG TPA: peptidoglycan DD-metalloendopeptidase family protein [Bacteroidota bacterium]|nr:peptidoglycan DD-metalloendopeptidase family protein [Bacteroidota bacterium]
MNRILHLILVSLVLSAPAYGRQTGEKEIKKREKELERLRNDIQSYERRLKESEKKERSTLDRLDDLERQSALIQELISGLHAEEQQITDDIDRARTVIGDLENQLQFLKAHYAGYVRSVYKNGRIYDLELLFSSRSINQLAIRVAYLKRFSEQRLKDLQSIESKKRVIETENDDLRQKLEGERQLLAEKTREEGTLRRKYSERRSVLTKVRKDKRAVQRELARSNEAVNKIEQIIADLVEKERVRKEHEEAVRKQRALADAKERERLNRTAPAPPPPEDVSGTSFEQRKGALRWPVAHGSIQTRFGNQIHPILKTVTQNTGIDIATPAGSDVLSVADGEVSVLSFIPGFGNVVIINHFNGFRTVYAHLSEVSVLESQRVQEGTVIGKSGESISGPELHFEIWKEREKQNPELWLAKR